MNERTMMTFSEDVEALCYGETRWCLVASSGNVSVTGRYYVENASLYDDETPSWILVQQAPTANRALFIAVGATLNLQILRRLIMHYALRVAETSTKVTFTRDHNDARCCLDVKECFEDVQSYEMRLCLAEAKVR